MASFVTFPQTMDSGAVNFAVIIPAYRPELALIGVISALSESSVSAVVVVDDGSGPEYCGIFRRVAEFPKVRLVRHAVNLGKGAALKTGINHAMCAFPGLQGVITADADGQHHPGDIQKVADSLAAEPDRVILGVRTFDQNVPLRSRLGNVITREVMRALVGQNVSDTQTGLRGLPASLLPYLLRLEANGYDFELDMLIAVRQRAVRITEVPIRTIYEPGNRTSHFNPLIDSMKIYFVLLRFSSVSLMTAALDTLVFYVAYRRLGNLAVSQVLGRLLAVAFNYSMVRRAVFFSKQRHTSVLPKYLLLVCLSGSVSYAGIQLLGSRFHIAALPAKLLVETLLFFANFAIQRDFIFGKSPAEVTKKRTRPAYIDQWIARILPTVLAVSAIALVGVVIYGFSTQHELLQGGWTEVGRRRLLHYTWVFAAASLALLLAVPRAYPPAAALLALMALTIAIGPAAVLAAAFFLISACALGSRLLSGRNASAELQLCATLLGIAVYIFLMTFLARLPVNYPVVYIVLLAIPVLMDLRGVGRRFAQFGKTMVRFRLHRWPQGAALALLAFVLGIHLLIVPLPEAGSDALAMHLAIPVNISLHHMLTYQPTRILWSVMPMGADWCYAMVYLLAGEYAARLLNFGMFLIVAALLYHVVRRCVSPAISFLIVALFASTSLVEMVTGSMMVENLLAAMIVGSLVAIWRFGETGESRLLYAAAVIGGTALAIKLGGLAYVAVALPLSAVEIRRQWRTLGARPVLACAAAFFLLLAAALPAYAISWRLTGDPVFPFLNQAFPSPILDHAASVTDYRYIQPLTLYTPFDLTFHTDRYFEGRAGGLGFAYLLLAPLGLLALLAVNRRLAAGAAAVSVAGALIVLKLLPNVRYLYPSLPLMLVPVAALIGWLVPGALRRGLVSLAVVCVLLNIWFLPTSNYYHGDFYEQSPLSSVMRQAYIHNHAPVREIGQYMNRDHPGSPVFLAEGSDLAAFNAEAYTNGWHQYGVWARLRLARSPQEILDLLNRLKVQFVAAPNPSAKAGVNPKALQDLLNHCTTPVYQAKGWYLARLESGCRQADRARRTPLIVPPGTYDDFDPAVVFLGSWSQNPGFTEAYHHTVTYSNLPGSSVEFAFQGKILTYICTKAANRGKVEVTIDGVRKGTFDFYSAKTKWQSRTDFGSLGAGPHLAVITLLPDKNPESTDRFIDVDSFEVY